MTVLEFDGSFERANSLRAFAVRAQTASVLIKMSYVILHNRLAALHRLFSPRSFSVCGWIMQAQKRSVPWGVRHRKRGTSMVAPFHQVWLPSLMWLTGSS